MLVSKMFSVRHKWETEGAAQGQRSAVETSFHTAGYLARKTACLISCSAFLNSLFTTQACREDTEELWGTEI